MGRRGPLAKEKDEHGRAIPGTVAVQAIAQPQVPAGPAPRAPANLHPQARQAWDDFWSSSAASWVDRGAHMSRLLRWVRDLDTYHRVLDDLTPRKGQVAKRGTTARGAPLGVVDPQRPWLGRGSRAQVTVHPNAELLNQLEQRIHRTEVEFGMTPYAAVRLAGAGIQGQLTAEQLNRLLEQRRGQQPEKPEQPSEPWAQGLTPAR